MSKCSFCDKPCLNDHCEFGSLKSQNVISNGGNVKEKTIEEKFEEWVQMRYPYVIKDAFEAGYETAKAEYEANLNKIANALRQISFIGYNGHNPKLNKCCIEAVTEISNYAYNELEK